MVYKYFPYLCWRKKVNYMEYMCTEEYRQLWQETIRECETESNEKKAQSFVLNFCRGTDLFDTLDDKDLLQTFVSLVVYEQKHCFPGLGSITPTSFCYRELLDRARMSRFDMEFILDVGDWAADYSDNGYVPMGNYRGYGPRKYFEFTLEYELRVFSEQQAKKERLAKKRAEGEAKVIAAKQRKQERHETIQELRNKTVDEALKIIETSGKSVFYYIELIEEWFENNSLDAELKEQILALFPLKSTKHNRRRRKGLERLE